MAIAFDAAATGTKTTDGTNGTLSWTHTPVGTPRGVVVYAPVQAINANFDVTGVTYGGVAMTEVAGSPNNKTTGETGQVSAWFLGSSIPTGAQSVVVSYATTATPDIAFSSLTYTADQDCSIVDVDATISSDSLENPSVTLSLGGVACACSIGFVSGQNDVSGITPLANWTSRQETDTGIKTLGVYTYDIVGSTDVTAGWTQTADDAVAIAIAIRENAAPAAGVGAGLTRSLKLNRLRLAA